MIYIHNLNGCAPAPLAHYLKALGILRLVAEQVDAQARGWWEGERFRLATTLSFEELRGFFLEEYEPTPMFNPWGGRSGFYFGSQEKSARQALNAIETSTAARFRVYQDTVKLIRSVIGDSTGGVKPDDEHKDKLVLAIRRITRGKASMWIDTVTSVFGTGEKLEVGHPALMGTGGNEGSGSYTSAYMAAIEECLVKRAWDHAIENVLVGGISIPACSWHQSTGQFVQEDAVTPWDFLLALEGACVVRSAVSSRVTSDSVRWMASPFYVSSTSYGYSSESHQDEIVLKNGKALPGRGEQWFPIWSQPTSNAEISQIFVEGRATTKHGRATDGWSMARAITSLGTRMGVREFVRYGYQQRNNLATHFAIPLGRFRVPERSPLELTCLDDLEMQRHPWLQRMRRISRSRGAPTRLVHADRRLSDALMILTRFPIEPGRWQAVLLALANFEGIQVSGSGFQIGPTPELRPEWATAADDGSAEFRLAMAFALQAYVFKSETGNRNHPIRCHWLPLDKKKPWGFATTGMGSQSRLQIGPEVVMAGRKGIDDAIALVERRLIEASQQGIRHLPLQASVRASASPADIASLVSGAVDLDRTLSLGRALMALDNDLWRQQVMQVSRPVLTEWPDDAWLVVRLAMLPWPLRSQSGGTVDIPVDPAVFRRLAGGDGAGAVELALRRLRGAGIQTTVRTAAVAPAIARLWAAAMAFPISHQTARAFLRRVAPASISPGDPS